MATIGNVTEYRIESYDPFSNLQNTKIWTYLRANTTYQEIDAASRALIGLTKNTYEDTILITKVSVNEVLAEE